MMFVLLLGPLILTSVLQIKKKKRIGIMDQTTVQKT